jgi:hypothetical protein
MKPRIVRPLLAGLLAIASGSAVAAQSRDTVVSTGADARDVSLTIYNGGFSLVRERRELALQAGRNHVRWEDVAQRIEPSTLGFRSITAPGTLAVREQNYQYDLISANSILDKTVGHAIRINRNGGERIEGTLISSPSTGHGMVIRTADGRLLLNPYGEVEVPVLPPGLISRPSLLWLLDADRGGRQSVEVSYLTGGMTWSADYVAVVDAAERRVDLTGWVTLNNQSGAAYTDAQMQLMAGNVRTVTDWNRRALSDRAIALESIVVQGRQAGVPQFAEEAFFEYHLYTLDGRTTVARNETKQMTLLSAQGAEVTRRLVFDSRRAWGWWGHQNAGAPSRTDPVKASIVLELENRQSNGMGMPLPAGVIRLYKADGRGNQQFLGEDRIDHTPRDEVVRLVVGEAFDVVGTRRVVSDRRTGDRSREITQEISIRNHKAIDSDVLVAENFGSEWRILESSHRHERKDAGTAHFNLRVPANTEVKVTYTVRIWW